MKRFLIKYKYLKAAQWNWHETDSERVATRPLAGAIEWVALDRYKPALKPALKNIANLGNKVYEVGIKIHKLIEEEELRYIKGIGWSKLRCRGKKFFEYRVKKAGYGYRGAYVGIKTYWGRLAANQLYLVYGKSFSNKSYPLLWTTEQRADALTLMTRPCRVWIYGEVDNGTKGRKLVREIKVLP